MYMPVCVYAWISNDQGQPLRTTNGGKSTQYQNHHQIMQLLFTVLFILGLAFQSFVDACSRKSPRPVVDHSKSTTAATVSSSSSSSTTTFKPVPPNRFNCTEEQISSTSCLNGGVCFSMMLGGSKASACK
ncbi:Hypothetical predicted protein [Octopus vulgaris]|uniref:Uncharacterized protein n=1 Tax=Octopus vulgaris TaxID=6645 RepID=A0AA36FKI2_OCTVU|nr:Hypothetical predicted protein [Octopus vulgaris]